VDRDRRRREGHRLHRAGRDGGFPGICRSPDLLSALGRQEVDLALDVLQIDPERVAGEEVGFSCGDPGDVTLVIAFERGEGRPPFAGIGGVDLPADDDDIVCEPVAPESGSADRFDGETGVDVDYPGDIGVVDADPVDAVLHMDAALCGERSHQDQEDEQPRSERQDASSHRGHRPVHLPDGDRPDGGSKTHGYPR